MKEKAELLKAEALSDSEAYGEYNTDYLSFTDEEDTSTLSKFEKYVKDVDLVSHYINVAGMFELRDGQNISMYKGINENSFTWKKYEKNLVFNNHN